MMKSSLVLTTANLVFSVAFAAPWDASNVKLDEYKTIYCPFDIESASLTADASTIDVSYGASTSPKTLGGIDKSACFVQFRVVFPDRDGNSRGVHLASIAYAGSGKVAETKAVWACKSTLSRGSAAPTYFPPAILDDASQVPVVISNSTRAWSAYCCREPEMYLNVRMMFDLETTAQSAPVSQSLKLGWEEGCPTYGYDRCELRDIDGERHPTCRLGQPVLQRPDDRD